jgi:hypothetical protein
MFFRSCVSIALAIAFVTLQGCAAETVTASSAIQPSISVPGPGASRADEPPRTTTVPPVARVAPERQPSHVIERHSFRTDSCRRCSN